MKHPYWLINSILLGIFLLVIIFIFFSRPTIPRKVLFKPDADIKLPRKDISKIDQSKIYDNDLFDTYKEKLPEAKEPELTSPLPKPPTPQPIKVPIPPPPKFLEPLEITLKGIIVVSDEVENVAIIEDAKEKLAKNYKVGDTIEDAQLIRIMKNKIILIRSNGQQETIYVNQHDAEMDQLLVKKDWTMVVKKESENNYTIDPQKFVSIVRNLAQCIDLFNLTTAYKQGENIGIRVGMLAKDSLGASMGLQEGDIITTINTIPATETDNRFAIYKNIISLKVGQKISVSLLRNKKEITITYTLKELKVPRIITTKEGKQQIQGLQTLSPEQFHAERTRMLRERKKFAPTIEEIKKREKRDILNHRSRTFRKNKNVLLNN